MKSAVLTTCLALVTGFAAPAFAELDPCLVGNWQADNTSLSTSFQQAMEQPEAGPPGPEIRQMDVSGQMIVEIAEDGAIAVDAYGLRFSFTAEGNPPMAVTVHGGSTGVLATGDGDSSFWIAPEVTAVNIEAEVLGMVIPVPNAGSLFPATDLVGSYRCEGATLVFAPDGPPNAFPRLLTHID